MCTIDKMLIKGIRSFSPDNNAVICFFRPLTLIVGPNGAGKTTIIECLKHATTGELPPNSRSGHSFIHDPKVAGETETKGQIKLRFKTAAGKDVVCVRSFQLTQKASKMEYKAIESVLQTINPNTGEKVCLSYRCADMDREVPLLMGVSKAILENVIFVHQDDANWPLAEGAVLKKKFDDIFSATRYTKALDTLKKMHKEQVQLIKEMKLKLEHLRTLRDAAARLQGCVEADREKVVALQGGISQLEGRIAEARQRQTALEGTLHAVRGLEEAMRVAESRREMLVRQKIQQRNDLEVENEDTDEELAQWQENFEAQVGALRLKIGRAEREAGDARLRLDALKEQHSADIKLQGRLLAEAEVHKDDCAQRDSILRTLFQRSAEDLTQLMLPSQRSAAPALLLDTSGTPGSSRSSPLPRDLAAAATEAVVRHLGAQQEAAAALKAANKEKLGDLTTRYEQAGAKLLQAEGSVQLSRQRKADCELKLALVRSSKEAADLSGKDLEQAKRREHATKEEMEQAAAALRERRFESALEEARTELFSVEQKLKGVQRERDSLAAESADRVSLRLKKDALQAHEQTLAKLRAEHMPRIEKLYGAKKPSSDQALLASDLAAMAESSKAAYEKLDARAKRAGNDVAALGMRLDDAKKDLGVKQQQLQEKRAALTAGMFEALSRQAEEAKYAEELKAVQDTVVKTKKDHDTLMGMRQCFSRFAEEAEARSCCPVCERAFSSDAEVHNFVQEQHSKQAKSAARLQKLQDKFEEFQKRTATLESLRPLYLEYTLLVDKGVPEARRAVDEGDAALRAVSDNYEDLLASLAEAKVRVQQVEAAAAAARELERLQAQAEGVRREVGDAEYKLDVLSQNLRSMGDITADAAALDDKRAEVSKRLERLREEQQHMKEEVAGSNTRWRNAREDRTALEHKLASALQLEQEATALEASLAQLTQDLQAAEQQVGPLEQEKAQAGEEREAARRAAEAEEQRVEERVRELQRDADRLKTVGARIEMYESSDKSAKAAEVSARVARGSAEQAAQEQRVAALGEAVAGDQEMLRSQALVKRNIDDNVAYRKTVREEAAAAREVEELQRRLIEAGEPAKVHAQAQETAKHIDEWLAQQNRSRGTLQAHEANISRNSTELKQAQYRDIQGKYLKQLIQLKTHEMALKDIDSYTRALDKALMRFHALKMEEINKIVKELWQQTYRGLDIDSIEIRSDAEAVATTASTRSYSYRVVMRSGDAELEMRGRCSAGQKVLASLIIRLALAETFCLNCGILALDEPTTNLDAPNAESLAAALLRLMDERKGQENFQLIVITHDERFAQLIGKKQFADHYYRVSKDDTQKSRIECQDIYE